MNGLRLVRLYFLLGVQGVKRAFGIEPAIPLLTRKQLNERYIKPAIEAMVKEWGEDIPIIHPDGSVTRVKINRVASTE